MQSRLSPLLGLAAWAAGCTPPPDSVRCHLYDHTASAPFVTAWDVAPEACAGTHILERVDTEGRVVELRFMNGDSLDQFTVYYPSRETFEYRDGAIVGEAYYDDGSPFGTELGEPFRTTYRVQDGVLLECRDEIAPLSPAQSARVEVHSGSDRCGYVTGYLYSRAKMSGVNPVAEGFDWSGVRLPYDERLLRANDYDL